MWRILKRQLVALENVRPRDANLRFRVPSPYGGPAWLTATVAVSSRPRGRGDFVRVRGHIDSCFQMPTAGDGYRTLAGAGDDEHALAGQGRRAAGALTRSIINRLPDVARRQLTEQRRRGWLDMQLSTAPLDGGAAALMPEPLRAICGDQLPRVGGPEAPRVGVWSGPAGGSKGGVAKLAMVQFDQDDAQRTDPADGEHVNLNLSVAELIEPAARDDDGD